MANSVGSRNLDSDVQINISRNVESRSKGVFAKRKRALEAKKMLNQLHQTPKAKAPPTNVSLYGETGSSLSLVQDQANRRVQIK